MEMRSLYTKGCQHDKLHTANGNISKAQTNQSRQYDRKHATQLYDVFDIVLLKNLST